MATIGGLLAATTKITGIPADHLSAIPSVEERAWSFGRVAPPESAVGGFSFPQVLSANPSLL